MRQVPLDGAGGAVDGHQGVAAPDDIGHTVVVDIGHGGRGVPAGLAPMRVVGAALPKQRGGKGRGGVGRAGRGGGGGAAGAEQGQERQEPEGGHGGAANGFEIGLRHGL